MRRVFHVLVAAVVAVSFSSMVLAHGPAQAEKKSTAKSAKVEKRSTVMAANGKVEKFDDATRTLTVATKDGAKEFALGADAKVMAGASAASTSDLAGKQVKVTYSVVDGKNVASKVTVAGAHPAAMAKKTEKK
jgi:hypothetical protein